MAEIQLAAEVRHETGKGAAHRLRQRGFIPAVLYGGKSGNVLLSVSSHDLFQIISKSAWETTLIDLSFRQEEQAHTVPVLIKELQTDPVRRTLVHTDFMEITMGQVMEVHIPLELVGEAPGVKEGGVLEFLLRELDVECLPSDIVPSFEIDISTLEIGDTLTVEDLKIGENFKVLTETDMTVLTVATPTLHEEEEVEEEEEEILAEPEVIQKGKKEEEEEEE